MAAILSQPQCVNAKSKAMPPLVQTMFFLPNQLQLNIDQMNSDL